MQNEDILPDEVADYDDTAGRKIKILPPSAESMRLAEESEHRMKELEAAGWTKELQEKMRIGDIAPPGYKAFQQHIHNMASIPRIALRNLEMATGITNENKTENQ